MNTRFNQPENYGLHEKQQERLNLMLSFLENGYSPGKLSAVSMRSYVLHFGISASRTRLLITNKMHIPQAFADVEDGKFPCLSGIQTARRISQEIDFLGTAVNQVESGDWFACFICAPMIGRNCMGLVDLSLGSPSYFVDYDKGDPIIVHMSEMEKQFLERTK